MDFLNLHCVKNISSSESMYNTTAIVKMRWVPVPKFTRPWIKGVSGWLLCFGTVGYMNGLDDIVLQHRWIYEWVNASFKSNGGFF